MPHPWRPTMGMQAWTACASDLASRLAPAALAPGVRRQTHACMHTCTSPACMHALACVSQAQWGEGLC